MFYSISYVFPRPREHSLKVFLSLFLIRPPVEVRIRLPLPAPSVGLYRATSNRICLNRSGGFCIVLNQTLDFWFAKVVSALC